MSLYETIAQAHPDWEDLAYQEEKRRLIALILQECLLEEIAEELARRGHKDTARILHGRATGRLEEDDEEGVIAAFLGGFKP